MSSLEFPRDKRHLIPFQLNIVKPDYEPLLIQRNPELECYKYVSKGWQPGDPRHAGYTEFLYRILIWFENLSLFDSISLARVSTMAGELLRCFVSTGSGIDC